MEKHHPYQFGPNFKEQLVNNYKHLMTGVSEGWKKNQLDFVALKKLNFMLMTTTGLEPTTT